MLICAENYLIGAQTRLNEKNAHILQYNVDEWFYGGNITFLMLHHEYLQSMILINDEYSQI